MCAGGSIFWLFILSAVSYLDRVNISIAGSSIAASYHLSNVQLGYGVQRVAVRLRTISNGRRKLGGPLRSAPRADRRSGVVGRLHGSDCAGAAGIRARCFCLSQSAFCWERGRR